MRINRLRAFNLEITGQVNRRKRIVKNIVVIRRSDNVQMLRISRRFYLNFFPGAE